MKTLSHKITEEEIKNYKLKESAMNDSLKLKEYIKLYEEINKTSNKIRFLKCLSKALKKEEVNDKDCNKINLR